MSAPFVLFTIVDAYLYKIRDKSSALLYGNTATVHWIIESSQLVEFLIERYYLYLILRGNRDFI